MHYYDHNHDPNTYLELTRQHENELLRSAKRHKIRPGLVARVCALLRGAAPARPAGEEVTISSATGEATRACSSLGHRG